MLALYRFTVNISCSSATHIAQGHIFRFGQGYMTDLNFLGLISQTDRIKNEMRYEQLFP